MEQFSLNTVYDVLGNLQKNFGNISLEIEKVGLEHLFGRYAAEDIILNEDTPCFDRALIDGYALISGDTFGLGEESKMIFNQVGQSEIGQECKIELGPNECVYISSGAMIPPNADAVVSPDDIELTGPGQVLINKFVDRWENVIRKGDDLKAGGILIKTGTRIGVREIGALAGAGIGHINVFKKLKAAVISTGEELVKAYSSDIKPGKVRDINSHMICDALKSFGVVPINMGIAGDDSRKMEEIITDSLETADIIIITGGSSHGTMDKTYNVIKRINGGEIITNKIAMEPGRDTIIAKYENKAIIGLPGNPISVLLILHILVRPLMLWLNKSQERSFSIKAVCTENYESPIGKERYLLVTIDRNDNGFTAAPILHTKGFITSMMNGNGFVKIRASDEGIKRGEEVEVILLQNYVLF
ncbi:MAG: molybdopterin molybdotransferase MoeA [Deltaproteobacteria bacterium]